MEIVRVWLVICRPTGRTKRIVMVSLLLIVVFWSALSLLIVQGCSRGLCDTWWAIILMIFFVVSTVTLIVLLTRQPRNGHQLHFEVPLMPWTPLASILVNVLLMVALSQSTWIRFVVWLTIGNNTWLLIAVRVGAALALWRPVLPYGYSYKASCARPAVICNFWHPGTLTLRAERQSARMSIITNDGWSGANAL